MKKNQMANPDTLKCTTEKKKNTQINRHSRKSRKEYGSILGMIMSK